MGIIEFKDVSFRYEKNVERDIIKKLNLEIEEGEYICILGSNGSGKSTVAKLINGLIEPDVGNVLVYGLDTRKKDIYEIRKRVGMVFQNPDNQMVATIVEDDIAFGPENIGVDPKEIGERIDFALNATNMMDYRYSSGDKLSGGQKQRIAISGVLAIKPSILILDESTSMLDPVGRKEVLEVVKKLNEDGITVISITHYMEEALEASRIIILNEGEFVKTGTPSEIFNDENLLKENGLELPRSVYLRNKLIEKGIKISKDVLKEKDLEEELCKLFPKI